MNVFEEFAGIVKDLERYGIRYALIGGVAMAFYAEPRFTRDIDLLTGSGDFEKIKKLLEEKGYFESALPWTFRKIELTLHRFMRISEDEEMIIDILVGDSEEIKKIVQNAIEAESEEGTVRVAGKNDLIWMKSIRDSKQDQADIEKLKNEEDR